MSGGLVEFVSDNNTFHEIKRINYDKTLIQIRQQVNIPDNYIFAYIDPNNNNNITMFQKNEEFVKKIKDIIINNKVNLVYEHPYVFIKQGDTVVKKLRLDRNMTLTELRRYLPQHNNEKFKCFDDEISFNEEGILKISNIISNDDVVYLTGTYNTNLNERGRYRIDRSRSVADNLDLTWNQIKT